jgi:nucleotide-binding universal stress UspA family protein
MYTTLLWATDGSAVSDRALAEALKALEPGGRLVAFHCDQRFYAGRVGGDSVLIDEPEVRATVEEQVEHLKQTGVDVELVVSKTHGAVGNAIVEAADEAGAEAIVCGTRGLGAVQSTLLGSVAKDLLHHSHVPLIIVPARVADRGPTAVATVQAPGVPS